MRCAVFGLFLLFSIGPGCQKKETGVPAETLAPKALQFDYEKVSELIVARNDASQGHFWTARFSVDARKRDSEFVIAAAPGGAELPDRRADTRFIRHLLDTFRTLQLGARAPESHLSSYGLAPPQFALRWVAEGRTHEIKIGTPLPKEPSAAYAQIGEGAAVLIVRGAALQMLGRIADFDVLRRRTLVTFDADDIDEFELTKEKHRVLRAERQTRAWSRAEPVLEGLAHARIRQFIDDGAETEKLARALRRAPYTALFKDRRGTPTTVKMARESHRLLATISTRPGAVFELHPEALRLFEGRP